MLNSKEYKFITYEDERAKRDADFAGGSGPLYLATHKKTGKKWLVKHTYSYNASNEFVACWLAGKLGVYAPKAELMTPDKRFASKYPVAIEFIDGFEPFDKKSLSAEQQKDLIAALTLHLLIDPADAAQFNRANSHIYAYDFSEAFCNLDDFLIKAYKRSPMIGDEFLRRKREAFSLYLGRLNFDEPSFAAEFNLDPAFMESEMIKTAKKITEITDNEISMMCDELEKMFPIEISVYYEDCVREMQKKVSTIKGK